MFARFQNVSMSSIIMYTIHKHAHTGTHTAKSHRNTCCMLCVQLKPNGDYGSLFVFIQETSCIFPWVALKIVVLSEEISVWFFYWVIIPPFVMHCGVQQKWGATQSNTEQCRLIKWWRRDMRKWIFKNTSGRFSSWRECIFISPKGQLVAQSTVKTNRTGPSQGRILNQLCTIWAHKLPGVGCTFPCA